jgi:hypothetical protein
MIIHSLKPSLLFPYKSFINFVFYYCLDCGTVPQLDNGNVVLNVDGLSSYGSEAVVTCEQGYNNTSETIQCLDTGKWDNTSCEIVGKYSSYMISGVK